MIVEQVISIQGTNQSNEDMIGYSGHYFWLMDGVTDLYGIRLFEEDTDSAVLVRRLDQALRQHLDDQKSLLSIVQESVQMVRENLLKEEKIRTDCPHYMLPTFTLVFARIIDGHLDYYILGDSYLIIEGKQVLTDDRIWPLAAQDKQLLAKVEDPQKRKAILQKTRQKLNQADGYWIGSIDGQGLAYALLGSLELTNHDRIMLCSDGFVDYCLPNQKLEALTYSPQQVIDALQSCFANNHVDLSQFKKRDDISLIGIRYETS
ncbi:SpoIIE family protein phosphatase [Streptococcus plurextorum]|uniref:SpoIIE family protein phosphatase n=1 Tax=Streptococcus plurextorum TaxID=456876 RepID=UPI00041BD4CB|nr:SpoIIE family protein phosphatase [Streptococcus plurextorum]